MGRPMKAFDQQTKHLTNEEIVEKKYMENMIDVGTEHLLNVSEDLFNSKTALNEYNRIRDELNKTKIIGNLDLANLVGYANAYSSYMQATRKLAKDSQIIEGKENPLIRIQIKYAEEMRNFAKLCGLTLDSRLKAAALKTAEEKEQICEDFGDI